MTRLTTDELLKQLRSTSSKSQLTEYNSALSEHCGFDSFAQYFKFYLNQHQLTESAIIQSSQIQRNYAYQILNGSKNPGREKVLALCIAANMNYEETQRALALADLGKLYPRRKEDSVIIFALDHKLSVLETNELLFEECGITL